jgi:two-component system chemotaxis response regulator CheY
MKMINVDYLFITSRWWSMKEKLKVLICDDALIIRKRLKESIRKCCSYTIFIDTKEGLEAISMYKLHKPDIVFMDIILPGRNGIEIVKEIKEFDHNANIVMVSTVGTKNNIFDAMLAGANDFIQKPWEQDTVDRIIVKCLLEEE